MEHRIITISRQFGSGGRTIGKVLAKQLGIPCYDQELIAMFAKESGFSEEYVKEDSEQTRGGLLASIFSDRVYDTPITQDVLWDAQKKVILQLAEKESCIIIGRAGDYVLKDHPGVVRVFVHASKDYCIEKAKEYASYIGKDYDKFIEKTDKFRGDFYRYYTGQEWTDARNYDLCLNSEKLGFEGTKEAIKEYIQRRFGKLPNEE